MKARMTIVLLLLLSFTTEVTIAQETNQNKRLEQLEAEKDSIHQQEKDALKVKVQGIEDRLQLGEISQEEAQRLKREAAREHAQNIENRLEIVNNQIALLRREGVQELEDPWADSDLEEEDFNSVVEHSGEKQKWFGNRTQTELVVAVGFNNALAEGQSVNDLDFKVGGSRFFELGLAWRTRAFDNTNWLRLKYGFSFQFNGLKPTDNRYFVQYDDQTVLEEHSTDLDKSKFRLDNLVFPLHFEVGPSKRKEYKDRVHYSTDGQFRIGLGGYAGFNLGKRQKLKYQVDGERIKQKMKHDYNVNEFVYGLSAYVGWGDTSAYVKYDLNPIFESPNQELRNISVGLRFDLD